MKVAFVLKYFLPDKMAGTEVYAAALCKELIKLGIDVVVIKPAIGATIFKEYHYENICVLEYPESVLNDKALKTGKRKPAGLHSFKELLLLEKPDVVHFHEITGSNGITIDHLSISKELDIPVFFTMHLVGYTCRTGMLRFKDIKACDGVVDEFKCSVCNLHKRGFEFGSAEILSLVGQWVQKNNLNTAYLPPKISGAVSYPNYITTQLVLVNDIFKYSKKVFVLSSWFKDVLIANKLDERKMILLSKALPSDQVISRPHSKVPKPGEPIRLVYLGRISKIKGLHVLLQSLTAINTRLWSLDIYGQVTEEGYFTECDKLVQKIRGSIKWKGAINPNEVVKTLQQYDVLVFPTVIQEMVGLVVQEAFAAGIPVIGSDAKGIAEQVTDGVDGLLFKSGDPISLQYLLNKVLSDKSILPQLASNIKTPQLFREVAIEILEGYSSVIQIEPLPAPVSE